MQPDAPNYERIYLQPFAGDEGSHTWCSDRISDNDIEYVRAASSQAEIERLRTLEAAVIAFMPLAHVAFLWQTKGARPGEVERYRDAYHGVKSALSGSKE